MEKPVAQSRSATVESFIKVSLCIMAITSLLGCQPVEPGREATAPTLSVPTVHTTVLPPMTMTPTPECLPVSGVDLEVVPLSTTTVVVKVAGLNSGEEVTIISYAAVPGQSARIESGPMEVEREDGSLEYTQNNLVDLVPGSTEEWHIQVLHSRGVACATISLP